MSINFNSLKDSLYDWVKSVVSNDVDVIFLNENSPRPENQYITLQISSFLQIGDDYIPRPLVSDGTVEQVGDREFTLQIGSYRGDSLSVLELLRTSLQKTTVLDSLRENNIVFVQQLQIQDLTQLISSQFEPRSQMDIQFRLAQTYDDILSTIESVEIDEIYKNDDSTVYTDTQTITI